MLNNLKIATKLFGGFAIVLVILVAVGLVGWWAIIQKTQMASEVDNANELIAAGLSMQSDIYDAMTSVNMETITKDEKYAIEVQKVATRIQVDHAGDVDMIQNPDTKKMYQAVLDRVKDFAAADAQAWQVELKRKDALHKRFVLAEQMMQDVDKLVDMVYERTKETAVTQEGVTYFIASRVEREKTAINVASNIRDIRRLCYQYATEMEKSKQWELAEKMAQDYEQMQKDFGELKVRLERPETQKLLDEIVEISSEWYKTVTHIIQLENDYADIDVKTTSIANELVAGIKEILPLFQARVDKAQKEDMAFSDRVVWILLGTVCGAVILGLFISFVLTSSITSGIKEAVSFMQTLAQAGDLSQEIPPHRLAQKDEIGQLAGALKGILDDYLSIEGLAKEFADGNWAIMVHSKGDKDAMNQSLTAMVEKINVTLHEIGDNVTQVVTGSNEVSTASQSLANGAQESAASLEEITASMSEISSQTKSNAENAGQARNLAQKASKAATDGQEAMQQMTTAMGQITQNSNEIQRVIKVIDDIAFQTNLLALNAAVEAARAGQHGKGFAVVAEEVRNLAARSAKAAKETSELIAKSGHEIEQGGTIAAKTAEVLNTIVDQIKQTTDLVAGIAVASNEQAQGVNQVTIGLQQIDAVTQQNTASSEESASAANEMSSMAANLQKLVAQFKLR